MIDKEGETCGRVISLTTESIMTFTTAKSLGRTSFKQDKVEVLQCYTTMSVEEE